MQSLESHLQTWGKCEKCAIAKFAIKKVLLATSPHDSWDYLFIGEAPGESENCTGVPFIGISGQILRSAIEETQKRLPNKVIRYAITNVIACKPQEKKGQPFRKPTAHEIKNCMPRIEELLEIIKPKVVIAVGNVARDRVVDKVPLDIRFRSIWHPSFVHKHGGIGSEKYWKLQHDLQSIMAQL